jgi:hypothetical protein
LFETVGTGFVDVRFNERQRGRAYEWKHHGSRAQRGGGAAADGGPSFEMS